MSGTDDEQDLMADAWAAALEEQVTAEAKPAHLQGPVVDPENTPDVVTDQSQVDDLLASLGF